MYCKHLAAEMDPLQPGDEVEMAEVTTGKLGNFSLFLMILCQPVTDSIILVTMRESCISDPIVFLISQSLNIHVIWVISESDG